MEKCKIELIKVGITSGGIACGPIQGAVNVELKYTIGTNTKYLLISEFMGIPEFYFDTNSMFEEMMHIDEIDEDDTAFWEKINKKIITQFEDIELGEYETLYYSIKSIYETNEARLLRLAVAILRANQQETENLINSATGKYIDEIDIPTTDIEKLITKLNI